MTKSRSTADVRNLADTNATDISNVEEDSIQVGTATFSSDVYTFTPVSGSFRTLQAGLTITFFLPASSNNTTTTPSLDYNGVSDTIKFIDGSALAVGDLDQTYNKNITLYFDGTDWLITSDLTGNASGKFWEKKANGYQMCTDNALVVSTGTSLSFAKSFVDTNWTISFANEQSADRIMSMNASTKTTSGVTSMRIQDAAAVNTSAQALEYNVVGRWY